MAAFKVDIDLSALLSISPIMRAGVFNTLAAAVERVTMTGAERWRVAVLKAPLRDEERRAYADSIIWRMTGPYSGEIVSQYKYVEDIETGRPAIDLKRMLDTSMKVRTSAKGRRYLIIPMRHNTPGNSAGAPAMPQHVYQEASTLPASKIIGSGQRASGTGAHDVKTKQQFLVRQRQYQWGGHLPEGMAPKLRVEHKTDAYARMYRFETKTPGGKSSSAYITFRVMAEGQTGWIIPAKPGLYIAKGIADELRSTAETIFGAAVQKDLENA